MKISIANVIKSGDHPGQDAKAALTLPSTPMVEQRQGEVPLMSGCPEGMRTETGQPVAELIEAQESGAQSDATPERRQAGTALVAPSRASRSERAFLPAMSVEVALARRAAIVEFTRKIMVRDRDFGEIGTGKPTLLKPGAEKLCNFFGLEPEFTPVADEIDWTGEQHGGEIFCYARYRCRLLRQ